MAGVSDPAVPRGDIMRQLADIRRRLRSIETSRRLESASIGAGGLRVFSGGSIRLQDGGDLLVQDEGDIRVEGGRIVIVDSDGNETFLASTSGLALLGLLSIDTGELLATNSPNDRWVAIRNGQVEFGRISNGTANALAEIRAKDQDIELHANFNAFVTGDNQVFTQSGGDSFALADGTYSIGTGAIPIGADMQVRADGTIFLISNLDQVSMSYAATTAAANLAATANPGLIRRNTSSRRHKLDIKDFHASPRTVLDLKPRTWRDRGEVSDDPKTDRWHVGLIAEEVDEIGLTAFVDYDADGQPESVTYDRLCVALLGVVKDQQRQLDALTAWATSQGFQPPIESDATSTELPKRRASRQAEIQEPPHL